MKNFLNISNFSDSELRSILDEALSRKINRKDLNKSAIDFDKPLEGKSMIMIFEKPSTRTRISFDIAIKQLGGSSIILNPDNIHYGKGDESLKDTAKVLTEYADIVMVRTSKHKNLEEFGKYLEIPIPRYKASLLLRNCVEPKIGLHFLKHSIEKQTELF